MNTFTFIKKNFSLLIIISLIIIILLQRACTPSCSTGAIIKKYEIIKRDTVTVKIPVITTIYKKGDTVYQETPVYINVPTYINIPATVDTASILREYHTLHIYKDTLQLKDSMGYVSVIDSISKNKITGRLWIANVNKTATINTIYLKERKNELYLGGAMTLQKPRQVLVGCNIMLKTKAEQIFGLGFGINPQIRPYLQGSMLWKVSLKK